MAAFKTYIIKALVKNKYTKSYEFIESDYEASCVSNAIKMMRKNLSGNSYSLVTNHIKEKSVFDFILENVHDEPLAWKYVNKVFPSEEDAKKFIFAKICKRCEKMKNELE